MNVKIKRKFKQRIIFPTALSLGAFLFLPACNEETSPKVEEATKPPADSFFYLSCLSKNSQSADMIASINAILGATGSKDDCIKAYWHIKNSSSLKVNSSEFSHVNLLSEFDNLVWLDLSIASSVNINDLEKLQNLRWLRLMQTELKEFASIIKLKNLESLSLMDTTGVSLDDIKEDLNSLRSLNLKNTNLSDITALSHFPSLTRLNIADNKNINDFSPLEALSQLVGLDVSNTTFSSWKIIDALPKLQILNAVNSKLSEKTLRRGLYVKYYY